jgi:hypothetical protein
MSPTRLPEMVTSPRCIPNQTSNVDNTRQFVVAFCHCSTSVNSNKILLTYSEQSLSEQQGRYVAAEFSGCLSSSAKHNYGCVSQFQFMIPSYVVTNHAMHLTSVSHNWTAFNVQSSFPLPYFFQRNSFVFNTIIIIVVNNQLDALFQCIYFTSLHVSNNPVLIIRRINCINTSSGIYHSV